MYGSVDNNSWNDCINEKKLIIKHNKSYIAAETRLLRHKIHRLVPRANTIVHVCDRIDAGELKGWPRGWSNLDSFRQSD